MTMRLMFPRDAVLALLEEPEFEDCMTLIAQRDIKPVPDVYLAVFVLQTEPVSECGLRLHPISTTIIGITKTSSKRLVGEGLHWMDTKPDSAAMDLLRAHFRAEEAFVNEAVHDIGYRLPYWRNHYRNGAGDLNTMPEIIIEDRGAAKWNASLVRIGRVDRETTPGGVVMRFHFSSVPNAMALRGSPLGL